MDDADDKENTISIDPMRQDLRRHDMYTDTHARNRSGYESVVHLMPPQRDGADIEVGAPGRKKPGVRLSTMTGKDIDWAGVLIRVRDHKDKEAFRALFEHFAPRVKAFLMRSGTDAAMAEECAQDVMASLWQKAHLFDASRASASTWIFTIARNRRIDVIRKQKRPEPEDLTWGPEHEPDQADSLALQQETEKLGQAIAKLPKNQKELIEKAYFGDLTHSQIAEETGLPLGTIKSRIRLALDRLRHAMK